MAAILIAEDERAINNLMAANLKLVGHTCTQVFDGADAYRLAAGDFSARAPTQSGDELGRTLNQMAAQVQEQLACLTQDAEAKQQLVDNLSHEMRTPLTAIGGYADYIQRAALTPEELMDAAGTIGFESHRLLNLSNQLVWLSVLAHEVPEFETLNIENVLQRAVLAVQPKAEALGVTVQLLPGDATVRGNADLLESLFVNLADNGIKACEKGGSVTRCAAPLAAGGCRVTVADTGRGMDAATLACIGQPFYWADKARSRAQGGADLGTALCFSIAGAHGAVLRYESTPGQGTTAAVEFPNK